MDKYVVPIAILIAGALIAGAVFFNGYRTNTVKEGNPDNPGTGQADNEAYKNVKAVSKDDHILGDANAKIKIVTFSDMECPYCIKFEATMRQIVPDYKGKVAWVYRHTPLDFHKNAMPAALASECVAEKGGEAKFWEFMEKVTAALEGKTGVVLSMGDVANEIGVDKAFVEKCVSDKKYESRVSDNQNDSFASGLQGTPYSVVIVDGKPVQSIDGAYPIDEVKGIIDGYLK